MNYYNQIPDGYQPLTMWQYFWYTILFNIPVIDFIVCVVLAVGGGRNINLRNYARSQFCYLILLMIFWAILFFTGALGALVAMF